MLKRKAPGGSTSSGPASETRRSKLSQMESVAENGNDFAMEQQQDNSGPASESAAQKAKERTERWKALQGRAVCTDPHALSFIPC